MNKTILLFFCFLIEIQIFGQEISLDTAINESAQYFIERINNLPQQRISIAVTNFGTEFYSSQSNIISEYILDELIKYFVNYSRFTIVDRQRLNEARNELNFNMSGEVNDETAQYIGRIIGAQIVVFGSIKPMGNVVRFQARAIRVETAEILGIYTGNVRQNDLARIFGRPPKQQRPPLELTPVGYLRIFDIGFGPNVLELLWGIQGGILLGNYDNGFNFLADLSGGFDFEGTGSLNFGGIIEKRFLGFFIIGLGGGVALNNFVSDDFYPYIRGTIAMTFMEIIKIGVYYDHHFDHGYKIGISLFGAPWADDW